MACVTSAFKFKRYLFINLSQILYFFYNNAPLSSPHIIACTVQFSNITPREIRTRYQHERILSKLVLNIRVNVKRLIKEKLIFLAEDKICDED